MRCLKQTDLQLSTTQHGRSILLLLAQLVRNLPALVIVAPGLHVGKHMRKRIRADDNTSGIRGSIPWLTQLHAHFAYCNTGFSFRHDF